MSTLGSATDSLRRAADEETPLLGRAGKSSDGTRSARLRRHMTVNVSKRWADIVLLFCYIITGLLDSSAVFIWGSFVSMQTGGLSNDVFAWLGLITY
jgi:hypothetical protein